MMPTSQSRSFLVTVLLCYDLVAVVQSFTPGAPLSTNTCAIARHVTSSTRLSLASEWNQRRGVEIPLLDLTETPNVDAQFMQPLPSAHLPDELTTVYVYGMQLTRPVHQMVVDDAMERGENIIGEMGGAPQRIFGHVSYKPADNNTDTDNSLVGAIGCTSQVLMNMPTPKEIATDVEDGETPPRTVLCRGSWRFVVREVVKTIPFPIAIVDELVDDEPAAEAELETVSDNDDEDDDEGEDDDDIYATLTPAELVQRTLQAVQAYVDQQTKAAQRDMTPLEQSITQDPGLDVDLSAQRQAAEEMAAVYAVFLQSLPDIATSPVDMYYAVAFMASELTNLNGTARRHFLSMTDGVARLRLVLGMVEEAVGMERARKLAKEITQETDDPQELTVGEPELPPWAKGIRKGTRLEYYWNEDWEWCEGEVVEEPVMVMNELILMIHFDEEEDGSTHRLPFTADEKVRWRPPQPKGDSN